MADGEESKGKGALWFIIIIGLNILLTAWGVYLSLGIGVDDPNDEDLNEAAKKRAIDSIEFRRNAVPVLFVITSILWIVVLFLARGEYKQAKKLGADYKFGSSTQDYGSTMNKKRQSLMNKVSSDGKARYKRRL